MPALNVSWRDARACVRWLARRTGRPYRLPSEAEREYAARAGTKGRWSLGRRLAPGMANYRPANRKYYRGRPAPAGSYTASRFGLHDVRGNVYEWVEDCWHDGYGGVRGRAPDNERPRVAPAAGSCELRVLRGGAWIERPARVRAAWRVWDRDWARDGFSGFRVALDLGAPRRPDASPRPRPGNRQGREPVSEPVSGAEGERRACDSPAPAAPGAAISLPRAAPGANSRTIRGVNLPSRRFAGRIADRVAA